jgi:hypothetical protein
MSEYKSRRRIITEEDCLRELYENFDEKYRSLNKWREKNLNKYK